ncbi:hypothetical protein F5Y00DRAFT_164149 [Daldinia vernicosa]|uniref:uncharacterized protein n=1 Tax=Daldinia vernicosa TaxID=114800 RepID=UPI00200810E1|nr:uncharacterized protein F5Y00DRAFT_164149 [Daldinia vernicosa]KAI0845701.1 hypothetical protein F5Y00DRAFT_164149 [Daldinia vernicosa]
MKTSFASTTLAILPILATVSAFEVADIYKTTLGRSKCTDIHLTEGHVLHANCDKPGYGSRADYQLDLNSCLANYLGSLNHRANGGFGGSCDPCHMDGTKLICECSIGAGLGTMHNEVELNDWDFIQVHDEILTCATPVGLEMRGTGKNARFFTA